jgi:hypothetical protein
MREIVYDMAGAIVPQVCCELKRDENGKVIVQPSGERLCCSRTWGHYPRYPHASHDDEGRLVEWR